MWVYVYIYVYICMHICGYMYMCIHVCICVCICRYMYIAIVSPIEFFLEKGDISYRIELEKAISAQVYMGNKPYICTHCGKAFSLNQHLKCQMSTHTGIKLYQSRKMYRFFQIIPIL